MAAKDKTNEWDRLMKLSIKELSAELLKNGLRADGATEKTELVDRLMQYHEYSTRTEESLVNNDGNFDARFAQNLLPLALIKSEKQLESLSNAHLRQLLISHPKSAAFRLRHSGLLEQVLTCWRELQDGYKEEMNKHTPDTNYDFNCVICQTVEATHVCVPCGHRSLCGKCQVMFCSFGYRRCPVCRQVTHKFVELKYVS